MASSMWRKIIRISLFLLVIQLYSVVAKNNVIELNEENWENMLKKEWMVEFYAPWCPACKALQPIWEDFSSWNEDLDIKIGQVDVTTSPGLSGRFMVTALPTIFHVLDGEFRQYRGTRDKDAFISFVEEKKWKSFDPIPSWKSPGSFQMSVVSYFFKLSQILRAVHNKLMEDYGLPTWGSYLIFAVATIFIGAILGLILVCVIDLIYPPKPVARTTASDQGGKGDTMNGTEEEAEVTDYLEDDVDLVDEDAGLSRSGSEEEEVKEEDEGEEEGSPNVRKRKPRKAD